MVAMYLLTSSYVNPGWVVPSSIPTPHSPPDNHPLSPHINKGYRKRVKESVKIWNLSRVIGLSFPQSVVNPPQKLESTQIFTLIHQLSTMERESRERPERSLQSDYSALDRL